MTYELTFYLTIVMLLFQDTMQVNILLYLTIIMLLFQDDLQVNILPYYRCAAVSR